MLVTLDENYHDASHSSTAAQLTLDLAGVGTDGQRGAMLYDCSEPLPILVMRGYRSRGRGKQ